MRAAWYAGVVWLVLGLGAVPASAASPDRAGTEAVASPVEVGPDGSIGAQIADLPLDLVLRLMSEKRLFDIEGPLPTGEPISITFSGLTLEDALKRLMRGYNYVVVNGSPPGRRRLMVMGKVLRPDPAARVLRRPVTVTSSIRPPPARTSFVPPTVVRRQQPGPGSTTHAPLAARPGNAGAVGTNPGASRPGNPPQGDRRSTAARPGQGPQQAAGTAEPENRGVKF